MTNPDIRTQYEGAILNQLVKNAEKLAVLESSFNQVFPKIEKIDSLDTKVDALGTKVDSLEQKLDKVYNTIENIRWLTITIGIGIIINIFSQPIVNFLFQ